MVDFMPVRGNTRNDAKEIRELLTRYFVTEGSVVWQWSHG
jgi:hypothetical protein